MRVPGSETDTDAFALSLPVAAPCLVLSALRVYHGACGTMVITITIRLISDRCTCSMQYRRRHELELPPRSSTAFLQLQDSMDMTRPLMPSAQQAPQLLYSSFAHVRFRIRQTFAALRVGMPGSLRERGRGKVPESSRAEHGK